jgi:hypothetical protein
MSTQITLQAPRRISGGRGWMAAVVLAVSLGLAGATFLALRPDGVAGSKPGAASVAQSFPEYAGPVTGTGPGLGQIGRLADMYEGLGGTGPGLADMANAQSAAAIPNAHNSSGFKRVAAERPGWAGPGIGTGTDQSCSFIGRQTC